MKTYGLTHEQLAMVSVVQREWAAKNPRATDHHVEREAVVGAQGSRSAGRYRSSFAELMVRPRCNAFSKGFTLTPEPEATSPLSSLIFPDRFPARQDLQELQELTG
jgi:hypothetical protein